MVKSWVKPMLGNDHITMDKHGKRDEKGMNMASTSILNNGGMAIPGPM